MADEGRGLSTGADPTLEQQIQLEKAQDARIKSETKRAKRQARGEAAKQLRTLLEKLSRAPMAVKIAVPAAIVVLVLVFGGIVVPLALDSDETQYVTESALKEAVNIENLTVADYTYKGIAEKGGQFLWMDTVGYRVKYEAHIRASYNMSEIEFKVDEANKLVTVYVPEMEVSEPVIDETKFGFLPENATADIKDVLALCKEDSAAELSIEEMRREAAESLQNIVSALTMPLLSDEWSLEFKDIFEYSNEGAQEVQNEAE